MATKEIVPWKKSKAKKKDADIDTGRLAGNRLAWWIVLGAATVVTWIILAATGVSSTGFARLGYPLVVFAVFAVFYAVVMIRPVGLAIKQVRQPLQKTRATVRLGVIAGGLLLVVVFILMSAAVAGGGNMAWLIDLGIGLWASRVWGVVALILVVVASGMMSRYPRIGNIDKHQNKLDDVQHLIRQNEAKETDLRARQAAFTNEMNEVNQRLEPLELELDGATRADKEARAALDVVQAKLDQAKKELADNLSSQDQLVNSISSLEDQMAGTTNAQVKANLKRRIDQAASQFDELQKKEVDLQIQAEEAQKEYNDSPEVAEAKEAANRLQAAADAANPVKLEADKAMEKLKEINSQLSIVSEALKNLREQKDKATAKIDEAKAESRSLWRDYTVPAPLLVLSVVFMTTWIGWVWSS